MVARVQCSFDWGNVGYIDVFLSNTRSLHCLVVESHMRYNLTVKLFGKKRNPKKKDNQIQMIFYS